jgi:hypothetical protein
VPFLFDVLEAPVIDKRAIVDLLLNCGVDHDEKLLPFGINPNTHFAAANSTPVAPEDVEAIESATDWNALGERLWKIANEQLCSFYDYEAYKAVENGARHFLPLTTDQDEAVSAGSLSALAWFPRIAADLIPPLRQLALHETEPYRLANCILTLGILNHQRGDLADLPWLVSQLEPDKPKIVRRAAAIALATMNGTEIPASALDILIDATNDRPSLSRDSRHIPLCDGNLVGYVYRTIHALGL